MILEQLERAFMVIGDKVIMAGGEKSQFEDYERTSELVVRPREPEEPQYSETRLSLNNMTKQAIVDLCAERHGVELNIRTEKKILITEYLAIQEHDS